MGNENGNGGPGQESGNQRQEQGTQGQEPGTQQEGTGQESGTQQEQQQGQQVDLASMTPEELQSYATKLQKDAKEARDEAARYRTERNTFQSRATELERANETDQQRQEREAQEAATKLEQLERENRLLKVGGAITKAIAGKVHDDALVTELLEPKVELDDDGKPSNLQTLLADLKASKPYLFKREDADGGDGRESSGDGKPQDVNDFIRGAKRRTSRAV